MASELFVHVPARAAEHMEVGRSHLAQPGDVPAELAIGGERGLPQRSNKPSANGMSFQKQSQTQRLVPHDP